MANKKKKEEEKKTLFLVQSIYKKALQLQLEQRSYKINLSVEHQCYVYYLDQFFKYTL